MTATCILSPGHLQKIQMNISNCPTDLLIKIAYSASNWIKSKISLHICFLHSLSTSANFTTFTKFLQAAVYKIYLIFDFP